MDIKYAVALAKAYQILHKVLLFASKDSRLEWPVCTNPEQRANDFKTFMLSLDANDPWANYYLFLCEHIEALLRYLPPKDKTKGEL